MLDVVYIRKSFLPWCDCIPTILYLYRCSDMVLSLFPWMIYAIHYLLLLRECNLSIAVIEVSTMPSVTNRCPIVDILCLISIVEMVFNRLSNVVLLLGIFTRPQATASLWLYRQFMLRKVCNPLLESNQNQHNLTIKHLRITVDREYT
jgi:hypothetical protein